MVPFLLVVALLYVLAYGLVVMGWFLKANPPEPEDYAQLSVLVAAHNEEANLKQLLPGLLQQDYPGEVEILILLDRCTDGSRAVVESFQDQGGTGLRFLEIAATPDGVAPKKHALAQGIRAARYPLLAFTDADCVVPKQWLRTVNRHFQTGAELVLGLGPYFRRKGLLNAVIRFETWFAGLQYGGLAGWGLPYMGVGRNLAYRKSFFERADGFGKHAGRLSGDDDLLVNRHARGKTTRVMKQPESQVYSVPEGSWRAWFRQKTRHISASPAYSLQTKLILACFHGLHGIFYLSLFAGLAFDPIPLLVIYAGRTASLIIMAASIYNIWQPPALLMYPLWDLLFFFYNLMLVPAGWLTKPKW